MFTLSNTIATATITRICKNANIIGNIKFKFCFTTAYSELQFNFGLFKSTKSNAKLWNTPIIVDTINSTIKSIIDKFIKYLAIANTIIFEIIIIIIFGIVLYTNWSNNFTGIYLINTAFSPSLDIAVTDMYIIIEENCVMPNIRNIINAFNV